MLTVAIPIHNGVRHLPTLMATLSRQTLAPDEILVLDDGSTDCTSDRLSDWARTNSRVRVVTHAVRRGRGAARQTLLGEVRTPLVAWLDADDEWHPARLERGLEAWNALAENEGDDAIVVSPCSKIGLRRGGESVIRLPHRYDAETYRFFGRFNHPPAMLQACIGRTSAFQSRGGFDETMNWSEDFEFFLRFCKGGGSLVPDDRDGPPQTYYYHTLVGRDPREILNAHTSVRAKHSGYWGSAGEESEEFALRRIRYIVPAFAINDEIDEARRLLEQSLAELADTDEARTLREQTRDLIQKLSEPAPDVGIQERHDRANATKRFKCFYDADTYRFALVAPGEPKRFTTLYAYDGPKNVLDDNAISGEAVKLAFLEGRRNLQVQVVANGLTIDRSFRIRALKDGVIGLLPN